MKTNLNTLQLGDLNENELRLINGGVWQYFATAVTVYAAINAFAYAVGYTVGTIEKALE